jgi:hypothetical protein
MIGAGELSPAELAELEREHYHKHLYYVGLRYGLQRLLELELVREIPVPSPTVGTDWSVSVPGGVTWEVLAVSAQLLTSAVVANRSPTLRFTDGTSVVVRLASNSNATASQSSQWSWSRLLGASYSTGLNTGSSLPLPDVPLQPAWVLSSSTVGIDVGDQWSSVLVYVREWSPLRVRNSLRSLIVDLDSAGAI